ncbi:MAG: formyltetrahydrofolate deformylase [Vicinamibacteraceae bacterium]
MNSAVLLVDCPDAKGLVASISRFLFEHGANILDAAEHRDNERGRFFMRVEFDLESFDVAHAAFAPAFQPLVEQFGIDYRVEYAADRPRTAILVSRYEHCLVDLLYRHRTGELRCDVPLIVSNHEDARPLAAFHGIPFHHIPVTPSNKAAAETAALALLMAHRIELIVLARYMQVLSPDFVGRYPRRIINVHHSFLPAFTGARPYHAAFDRGVKLIGATAHYVTDVLDEGPIIEQDVARVSHRDQIEDLIGKGRDVEKVVLSRAVRWHLDHRVLVSAHKTIVFD